MFSGSGLGYLLVLLLPFLLLIFIVFSQRQARPAGPGTPELAGRG